MTDHTELDAKIAALGLTYKAEFIPQRLSRNAGDKHKSLNWRVTIAKGDRKPMVTDYMQGIGHLPPDTASSKGFSPYTLRSARAQREGVAAEHGTYEVGFRSVKVAPPLLRDVLYCLVSDASALDARDFEEWAGDYGYDTDSRKAEETYELCRRQSRELEHVLGRAVVAELREAFQDY